MQYQGVALGDLSFKWLNIKCQGDMKVYMQVQIVTSHRNSWLDQAMYVAHIAIKFIASFGKKSALFL